MKPVQATSMSIFELGEKMKRESDALPVNVKAACLEADLLEKADRIAQLEAHVKELTKVLCWAVQIAQFEKHAYRPWHDKARSAIEQATGHGAECALNQGGYACTCEKGEL